MTEPALSSRRSSNGIFQDVDDEQSMLHSHALIDDLTRATHYDPSMKAVFRFTRKDLESFLGPSGGMTYLIPGPDGEGPPELDVTVSVSARGNIYPDLEVREMITDQDISTHVDSAAAAATHESVVSCDKDALMKVATRIRDQVLGLAGPKAPFDVILRADQSIAFTRPTNGTYPTVHCVPHVKMQKDKEHQGEDDFDTMCGIDFVSEGCELVQIRPEDRDFILRVTSQDTQAFRELKGSSIIWTEDEALEKWIKYLQSQFEGLEPSQRAGWASSTLDTTRKDLKDVQPAPSENTDGWNGWMDESTAALYASLQARGSSGS